jgi:hypothetical protein
VNTLANLRAIRPGFRVPSSLNSKYSLGITLAITLWEMLTGRKPFQGSPAELTHDHLQIPAPLRQLKCLPRPIAVLLEVHRKRRGAAF